MAIPSDTNMPEQPNRDRRSSVSAGSVTQATPSGTSPNLPCELLVVIARYAVIFENGIDILKANNSQHLPSSIERGLVYFYDIDGGAQTQLAQLSRVNKTWHEALTPLLLARPVLPTPLRLRQLAKFIDLHPCCRDYLRELVLYDVDSGKRVLLPCYTPRRAKGVQTTVPSNEKEYRSRLASHSRAAS
jgi:hypothetical protein